MAICDDCVYKEYFDMTNKRRNELKKHHIPQSLAFESLYFAMTDKRCVGVPDEEALEMLRLYLNMKSSRDFWLQVAGCGILFFVFSLYLMWKQNA